MKYDTVHSRTPALTVIDARGLPIRQIAYLHSVAADPPSALVSCQHHDVAGRLAAQYDPRLPVANATNVYALDGTVLYTDSADSGLRLVLPGLAGEPLHRWDKRDHHWQSTFDMLLRVKTLKEASGDQIDSFSYGESSADGDCNLRGQLIEQTDFSGSLKITGYALTGQAIAETRTFRDGEPFTTRQMISPVGAVLEQTDAGGHRRASRHGLAGQLRQVDLEIKGHSVKRVMLDAQYNANNQIIAQLAGNGVLSQWTYDPADGRLHTQTSHKPGEDRLQDLAYFYDRVGNIIRIEDHAFEPTWFANQRVDGHREFIYDSLYRLIRATGYDDALPPDIPGLPQPTDPKNRRNYTQTYTYDKGGNLIELCHQRDEGCRTRRMHIDSESNRAVRRETGDDEPDFGNWFDLHGNQSRLRHGPTLHWNNRDELEHIDLVIRKDSANDTENYRYSQGVRVLKYRETVARGVSHIDKVRYLPGLEIRSKDNGEELHIISVGNARCLHWVSNPPAANTQLRYTLEDHLGSCVMELNEEAVITSEEGYYPFGETAWMAPESEIEYRFIRYSGKEMDASGLYYYGARYYAPWLQRWVSADPAGDVDGLNLYAFVSNNPVGYIDADGQGKLLPTKADYDAAWSRHFSRENASYAKRGQGMASDRLRSTLANQILKHVNILGITQLRSNNVQQQMLNQNSTSHFAKATARRTAVHVTNQALSYGAGIVVGLGAQALGVAAPGVGNVVGVGMGIATKTAVSFAIDYVAEKSGLSTSVKLKASALDPDKIIRQAEYKSMNLLNYLGAKGIKNFDVRKTKGQVGTGKLAAAFGLKFFAPNVASEAGAGLSLAIGAVEIVKEVSDASSEISDEKYGRLFTYIPALVQQINDNLQTTREYFAALSIDSLAGVKLADLETETARITGHLQETMNRAISYSKKPRAA
ncbi:toxin [Pseudomonas sp. CFBP13508]|nr:RHS repeat-associated core domain-containing protein [Pseudomonas sp. CFBP13508]TKJ73806.1 toxin [Pseudomonas sp. CFBP13508]